MRDISKRLTVINTEKKDNTSGSNGQSSGVTYVGLGGGGVGNLKDYLLKSIWDSAWELRTDSQGTEYIFGKLPIVTQYGITMYSGGNVDIPTIAEGLPFDNRTIWFNSATGQIEVIGGTGGGTGGGSGEGVSNFWDLSGIPSWITNTKPTYSYSEIQGTPDLSKYALSSDIPSLSGYATEAWVLGKGYALASDLAKYIPIAGVTDITGEKNFTGGLKVNGSPIVYDSRGFWKLEGDLLVTGGVTMYGNDSEFVPSTIMDAILYDSNTLGINSSGKLYVKGSVGGATTLGSLTNVGSWADSVASQDRIMYQAANSSQWVAKNLSDLAVGGVTGNYLPLTGGELSGSLAATAIQNGYWAGGIRIDGTTSKYPSVGFHIANVAGSRLYVNESFELIFEWSTYNPVASHKVLHSGNYYNYALPLSGGTLTNTLTIDNSNVGLILHRSGQATPYIRFGQDANNEWGELGVYNDGRLVFWPLVSSQGGYGQWNTVWHSGNDGSGSGLDADLLDGLHLWDGQWNSIPRIGSDGVMEIGKYIDFHHATSIVDYSVRIISPNIEGVSITLPSSSGTLALTSSNVASATRIQAYQHNSGENVLISGSRTDNTFPRYIYDNGWGLCLRWQEGNGVVHNGTIATLNDNVASATKLATPRTIWGQSFDGTGNVDGDLTTNGGILMRTGTAFDASKYLTLTNNASQYGRIGIHFNGSTQDANDHWGDGGRSIISFRRKYGTATSYTFSYAIQHNLVDNTFGILYGSNVGILLNGAGNVGIGTTNPESYKLYVNGSIYSIGSYRSAAMIHATGALRSDTGLELYQATPYIDFHFNSSTADYTTRIIESSIGVLSLIGSLIVTGGITMYSDQRKKTILNHVELSLQQVANAPLIEHYYNSDQNKTTHVGSIAQYWAEMNDWFCKKDSEGFYTMEIQNAALASAISVARELVKFETETDRRIKVLEEENKRLKEEIEQLKWNIA